MKQLFASTTLAVLLLAACSPSAEYRTVDGQMLGTTFHIVARLPHTVTGQDVYARMMSVDSAAKASMSLFEENSLLARLNSSQTDSLDSHITYCLQVASDVWQMSGGMYDVTVKPLTDAYGFARKNRDQHPNIDSLLPLVGFEKIAFDGGRLRKADSRMQIDLNSLAKGYVVDMSAEALESMGATDYIVEIGGEIRARGVNPKGERWRVAVDSPFDGNMSPGEYEQAIIKIDDGAMATSGNYRRYYVNEQGEKIAHTIDPKTGHSALSRLLSATVVARNCTIADAMATMFITLGEKRAIEMARQADSVQVYFVIAPEGGLQKGGEYEIFSTLNNK